jgi:hypothetical protein
MFTLEQKMFIVQYYFRNGERLENGEWSYSTPQIFEEFQQKVPDFQGTYQQLALSIFPYVKNNVFKNRPATIPELMQVITDIPTSSSERLEDFKLCTNPTLQNALEYIK